MRIQVFPLLIVLAQACEAAGHVVTANGPLEVYATEHACEFARISDRGTWVVPPGETVEVRDLIYLQDRLCYEIRVRGRVGYVIHGAHTQNFGE